MGDFYPFSNMILYLELISYSADIFIFNNSTYIKSSYFCCTNTGRNFLSGDVGTDATRSLLRLLLHRGPLHLALLCSVCAAALTFLHLLCLASSEADGRLVGHWGQGHGHPNLLHYWEDVLLIGQLLNSNLLRQRKTMQCMKKAEKKTYPQQ